MDSDERPGGEIRKVAVPAREITGGEPAIEAAADPASDARAISSARPLREVRAQYDDHTVTVYQAYREELARLALERQTLHVPGFGRNRTTWIKPSFTWMLYRAGYGLKESGQQRILALRVTREVFDGLLEQAALGSFVAGIHGDEASWRQQRRASPVVVQWDPERTVDLRELPWRAIQMGAAHPGERERRA